MGNNARTNYAIIGASKADMGKRRPRDRMWPIWLFIPARISIIIYDFYISFTLVLLHTNAPSIYSSPGPLSNFRAHCGLRVKQICFTEDKLKVL